MRIAMWSGPRNLSTAMMYSFAARGDCAVWDEPFYAPFLAETGRAHPMRDDILRAHQTDAQVVAARCAAPPPGGAAHHYMKHMPHHMCASFPLDWAEGCVHTHLIRYPARVIASYAAKHDDVTLEDIGFATQADFWRRFPGPVVDSADIRADPAGMLARLCAEIALPWTSEMLSWPAGPKAYDGVWAAHWYGAVHRSTRFAAAEGPVPQVPERYAHLLAAALPVYEEMRAQALRP